MDRLEALMFTVTVLFIGVLGVAGSLQSTPADFAPQLSPLKLVSPAFGEPGDAPEVTAEFEAEISGIADARRYDLIVVSVGPRLRAGVKVLEGGEQQVTVPVHCGPVRGLSPSAVAHIRSGQRLQVETGNLKVVEPKSEKNSADETPNMQEGTPATGSL